MERRRLPGWLVVSVLLLGALALSACLPDGVRVPQNQLSGLLERKSGLIAYLGTDGNIYTIDQGGGRQTAVTKDAVLDGDNYLFYGLPTWSPDSQSLAFDSYTGLRGQNPTSMSLFTAHKDGAELQEALKSDYQLIFYYWSPDSKRLALIASTANNSLSLQVVAPGGSPQLVDTGAPFYWSWAPDGNTILAHAGGADPGERARLSLLQLDPSVSERAFGIQPAEFKAPAFSPDGKQVLVAGEVGEGKSALLLTDATGGNPQTLAEYSGSIAFVWSPDGKRVAYVVSDDPSVGAPGHLVVLDPAGKAKTVELDGSKVLAFFWSPNSKSLAYFSLAEVTGDGTATPSASSTPVILNLSVMDARTGKSHSVATYPSSEQFLNVVPYFDQFHPTVTIWSPDSKNLVVSAYGSSGTPGIWVVEASGHLDPRHVADGWMGFWSWH